MSRQLAVCDIRDEIGQCWQNWTMDKKEPPPRPSKRKRPSSSSPWPDNNNRVRKRYKWKMSQWQFNAKWGMKRVSKVRLLSMGSVSDKPLDLCLPRSDDRCSCRVIRCTNGTVCRFPVITFQFDSSVTYSRLATSLSITRECKMSASSVQNSTKKVFIYECDNKCIAMWTRRSFN